METFATERPRPLQSEAVVLILLHYSHDSGV